MKSIIAGELINFFELKVVLFIDMLKSTLLIERPAINKVIEEYPITPGAYSKLYGIQTYVPMNVSFFMIARNHLDELYTDHQNTFESKLMLS